MPWITAVIDFILKIDVHLAQITSEYGVWAYIILFVIVFAETGLVVTPFLPGDSLLFAAGAICALGTLNVVLLMGLLITAAIIGDGVNYAVGSRLGTRLFSNPRSRIFKQSHLKRTHDFYEKHGGKTIVLARFMPIIRTFAPFVAGIGKMRYGQFVLYNVTGAIAWVVSFTLLGFYFGNQPIVKQNFSLVVGMIIVISVIPAVWEVIRSRKVL